MNKPDAKQNNEMATAPINLTFPVFPATLDQLEQLLCGITYLNFGIWGRLRER